MVGSSSSITALPNDGSFVADSGLSVTDYNGTSIAGATPVVGGTLQTLLREGASVGAGTLTRFFAFHVLWFPAIVGALVLLHLALALYHGLVPNAATLQTGAPARTDDGAYAEYYQAA